MIKDPCNMDTGEMANKLRANRFLDDVLRRTNAENIKMLVEYIAEGTCALVLGAGASKDVGMPLWGDLIGDLVKIIVGAMGYARKRGPEIWDALLMNEDAFFGNINSLEAAEYVHIAVEMMCHELCDEMGEDGDFASAENYQLASVVKHALRVRHGQTKSDAKWTTLKAIARLLPRINHVISYNYDDSLEAAAMAEKIQYTAYGINEIPLGIKNSLFATPSERSATGCPIYHVHGRLSVFNTFDDLLDMKEGIVLSERSYSLHERVSYNQSNTRQALTFTANNCLFIGFSCQDQSFRRILLNIPGSMPKRSFYIQMLNEEYGVQSEHKKNANIILYPIRDVRKAYFSDESSVIRGHRGEMAVINELLKMQAKYLVSHNLYPIFVEFSDIPRLLRLINMR